MHGTNGINKICNTHQQSMINSIHSSLKPFKNITPDIRETITTNKGKNVLLLSLITEINSKNGVQKQ